MYNIFRSGKSQVTIPRILPQLWQTCTHFSNNGNKLLHHHNEIIRTKKTSNHTGLWKICCGALQPVPSCKDQLNVTSGTYQSRTSIFSDGVQRKGVAAAGLRKRDFKPETSRLSPCVHVCSCVFSQFQPPLLSLWSSEVNIVDSPFTKKTKQQVPPSVEHMFLQYSLVHNKAQKLLSSTFFYMVMQERRLHFAGGSRCMAVALRIHLAVQSNPI